jgi:heme/copper-type cytochrome/quinol oxidase subunit 3
MTPERARSFDPRLVPERAPAERPARPVVDVSALAPGAFGHRSLMWWGTMGLVFIEGTAFALAIAAYFYLRIRTPAWPPSNIAPPWLRWGTLNTIVLLASAVPNQLAKNAAERVDLGATRLWLVVCLVFGVAFNAIRVLEFTTLNVTWTNDAYGSIVWLLLGLHTTHILTDVLDTGVLTALMFIGPLEEKRFVDVSENALYWYFVVLTWLPIYGVIYWAPRVL